MAGTFTNLVFHIVFSTKDRMPREEAISEHTYEYIGGVIRGEGGTLLEIGGMPDHVHILARFKADTSVSEMLRKIKSNSSRCVNELPATKTRFEWQGGYAAFSVSESQIPAVRRYIQNQKEHHRRTSYRDELVTLLKRNRVEYDARYLLG